MSCLTAEGKTPGPLEGTVILENSTDVDLEVQQCGCTTSTALLARSQRSYVWDAFQPHLLRNIQIRIEDSEGSCGDDPSLLTERRGASSASASTSQGINLLC